MAARGYHWTHLALCQAARVLRRRAEGPLRASGATEHSGSGEGALVDQRQEWEDCPSGVGGEVLLRQAGPHLPFHDLLQQHDCLVIEVDAERSSLSRELQREPLCFWHVAGGVLGADPHRE
jgi:hypothetical protein